MITSIFDTDIVKVLSLFALSPGSKFRRQEIQLKTKINNVPLDKALSKLVSSNVFKKEKLLYSIEINDYSKGIISLLSKQYKELKELPLDVYFTLIEISSVVSTAKDVELYLFGSYSKLIYTENSDIDLAVITNNKSFKKENLTRLITKLEGVYGKTIETHYFEKTSFYKNKSDPLVKDILRNGVKLVG